jgi:hypothetical protein
MKTPDENVPPGVPKPVPIPEEDFDEFLEWTTEEEEEFLKVLDNADLKDENGNI